jgi:HAD superfamily phosphatase (TIGR01668 family)
MGTKLDLLKAFYPYEHVESAYGIDYEDMYRQGFRGIIYDIDNTLTEHGQEATRQAVQLFGRLRELGFKTCVISNNKEPRVAPFANAVGTPYVSKAGKPSPKNYIRAMEIMSTDRSNTVFVGDQIFTDVWGANRAGVRSYLVDPIARHEEFQIVLKRYLERLVLWSYARHHKGGS